MSEFSGSFGIFRSMVRSCDLGFTNCRYLSDIIYQMNKIAKNLLKFLSLDGISCFLCGGKWSQNYSEPSPDVRLKNRDVFLRKQM